MDSVFENAQTTAPVEGAVAEDEAKKAKTRAMKEAMKETINSDTNFAEKLRRLSESLKVVNTLGYGTSGNIVVDKSAKTEGRQLKPTSQIVGYTVQNIGSEAIAYQTEKFAADETGKFVGTVVEKTLAPGETINLSRKYMTMLCAKPEISFTLSNGKIVASSKKTKTLDEQLSAYYFTFDKDENGYKPEVNDDEIKLSIDVDGVVKPEYVEDFGYFNNPKEAKTPKAKGAKLTVQDFAANYINSLIQKSM